MQKKNKHFAQVWFPAKPWKEGIRFLAERKEMRLSPNGGGEEEREIANRSPFLLLLLPDLCCNDRSALGPPKEKEERKEEVSRPFCPFSLPPTRAAVSLLSPPSSSATQKCSTLGTPTPTHLGAGQARHGLATAGGPMWIETGGRGGRSLKGKKSRPEAARKHACAPATDEK